MSSFNSITKLLDRISVYKYKYNVSEFKGTVDEFGDYISYLETLYESNSRIYNTIVMLITLQVTKNIQIYMVIFIMVKKRI